MRTVGHTRLTAAPRSRSTTVRPTSTFTAHHTPPISMCHTPRGSLAQSLLDLRHPRPATAASASTRFQRSANMTPTSGSWHAQANFLVSAQLPRKNRIISANTIQISVNDDYEPCPQRPAKFRSQQSHRSYPRVARLDTWSIMCSNKRPQILHPKGRDILTKKTPPTSQRWK